MAAIMTPLESTQACIDFWQPHYIPVFSPKEHIIIIIAQIAMFFSNLPARKECTREWLPIWTLYLFWNCPF
jgi:hypothetical protein